MQYTALVQKPPIVTNRMTGLVAKSSLAPSAFTLSTIACPLSNPKLKQALITPAKRATANPLVKAKSFTAARFSSSLMFLARKLPA